MSSSTKLQQMIRDFTKTIAKTGAQDITVMPSKLPNSKFVYVSKDGNPFVGFVSTLDVNKNVKQIVKEMDEHSKSVRIYDSNPADSSVLGKPLSVLMQTIQDVGEDIVNRKGDSSSFLGVVTNKGLKSVNLSRGQHLLHAIGPAGRKHKADLVVVGWGGWERSPKPPNERTGREVVATTVVSPDGTVFADLSRTFTRNGKKITWGDKNEIEWSNGKLRHGFNPRFNTAWNNRSRVAAVCPGAAEVCGRVE